jgi:hypothetical protein
MSPELSGGPFCAEDRNKMSPRWNPGSIEPERTTTTLRRGKRKEVKKRARVSVGLFFCSLLPSFLPKKQQRDQLTGDSEPVKRIRDFQIISAEVMMRPAGW